MFALHSTKHREVSEWLKEHAWKVCMLQGIESSNLFLSAEKTKPALHKRRFFHFNVPLVQHRYNIFDRHFYRKNTIERVWLVILVFT